MGLRAYLAEGSRPGGLGACRCTARSHARTLPRLRATTAKTINIAVCNEYIRAVGDHLAPAGTTTAALDAGRVHRCRWVPTTWCRCAGEPVT